MTDNSTPFIEKFMTATLDKIKSFLNHPTSFVKLKQNKFLNEIHFPKEELWGQALPLTEDLYHPLNPCFLFELTNQILLQHGAVITVRDGFVTLMDFLLKNHQKIPHLGTTFLIPTSLEKLIPVHLKSSFLSYEFNQVLPKNIPDHKFIYAHLTEEYLGENIEKTLEKIQFPDGQKVTLFLSEERNLSKINYDNLFSKKFTFQLSQKLKNCQVRFIDEVTFCNETDFSQYEFIDLAADNYLTSDNFISFLMASRGCRNVYPELESGKHPVFQMQMGLYHQMNIFEIQAQDHIFSEMLLHKKHNPHKEFLMDESAKNHLRYLMQSSL